MKAVQFHEKGPADVLKLEDVPAPVAGAGELLIRIEAAYTDLMAAIGG